MTPLVAAIAVIAVAALAACVWLVMDRYPEAHATLPHVRAAVLTALPLAVLTLTWLALT